MTQEFCDSQRNPDIEDYSTDLTYLLYDSEDEPVHEQQSKTMPLNPQHSKSDDIKNEINHIIHCTVTDLQAKNNTSQKKTENIETTKWNKSKAVAALEQEQSNLKRNIRKQVTSTVTSSEYLNQISANVVADSRKRQFTKKITSDDIFVEVDDDVTMQPKHRRISKPPKNAKNDKLSSLPQIIIDNTGKLQFFTIIKFIRIEIMSFSNFISGSESNSDVEIKLTQSSSPMLLPNRQVDPTTSDVAGATILSTNQKCDKPVVPCRRVSFIDLVDSDRDDESTNG